MSRHEYRISLADDSARPSRDLDGRALLLDSRVRHVRLSLDDAHLCLGDAARVARAEGAAAGGRKSSRTPHGHGDSPAHSRTQAGTQAELSHDDSDNGPSILCCAPGARQHAPSLLAVRDILAIRLDNGRLTIWYVGRQRRHPRLASLSFADVVDDDATQALIAATWAAAYPAARGCRPFRRFKVLLNPFGGQRRARSIYRNGVEPVLRAAGCEVDLEETQYRFHARDIAEKVDVERYDAIVCISGDGLPHEVFNGLGRRADGGYALAKMPVAFIPAGSGNGAARSVYNTHDPIECALGLVKGQVTAIDLMSITQPGQPRLLAYFSLSFGVIADCDVGTDHLRFLGPIRFDVGVVQRVLTRRAYPCELSVLEQTGDKATIRKEYDADVAHDRMPETSSPAPPAVGTPMPALVYPSIDSAVPADWRTTDIPKMGTIWAGLMPYMAKTPCVFPAARPGSGALDLMWMPSDAGILAGFKTFAAVDDAGHYPSDMCRYSKVKAFRIVPKRKRELISVDGEPIPPGPLQVELHEGLGRILTIDGKYFSKWRKEHH